MPMSTASTTVRRAKGARAGAATGESAYQDVLKNLESTQANSWRRFSDSDSAQEGRSICIGVWSMEKFRREYLAYNCTVHDFDNKPLDAGGRRGADAGVPGNYLCMVGVPRPAGTTLRMV